MTYSSICANAKRGASELIQGDRASIELTERSGCQLFGEPAIAAEEAAKKKAKEEGEVEGGLDTLLLPNDAYKKGVPIEIYENETPVDQLQMEAFANDIMTGGTPKANEMVGLYTAIAGLAGLEAVREGKEVEIDPALAEFDFETPDPYRYDFYDGPSGFGEDEAAPAEEA
jgi:hypothetical protein